MPSDDKDKYLQQICGISKEEFSELRAGKGEESGSGSGESSGSSGSSGSSASSGSSGSASYSGSGSGSGGITIGGGGGSTVVNGDLAGSIAYVVLANYAIQYGLRSQK